MNSIFRPTDTLRLNESGDHPMGNPPTNPTPSPNGNNLKPPWPKYIQISSIDQTFRVPKRSIDP